MKEAFRARRPGGDAGDAIMFRKAVEGDFEHHLAGARGPSAFALHSLHPFEIAADVDEQTGEVRSHRLEGPGQPAPEGA